MFHIALAVGGAIADAIAAPFLRNTAILADLLVTRLHTTHNQIRT